jgi:hypothetical protein
MESTMFVKQVIRLMQNVFRIQMPIVLVAVCCTFIGCRSTILKEEYSPTSDREIDRILKFSQKNEWAKAEVEAKKLLDKDNLNPSVQRLYNFVSTERQLRQEKHLEAKIRSISENDSRTNPTLVTLLKDNKYPTLPPRREVRDAVDAINATPYVPPSFGKSIPTEASAPYPENEETERMEELLEQKVSLKLDKVTLESLIFNVLEANEINVVADRSLEAFKKEMSINVDNIRISDLLERVSRNFGVFFQWGPGMVWILDGKADKSLIEETRYFRLERGFVLPAKFGNSKVDSVTTTKKDGTRTVAESQTFEEFVQDGAPIFPSIETAVRKFFKGSDFLVDYEQNLIIATGTPDQLKVIDKIIEAFDRPIQQVLIEARFITVTESGFLQLGALWETGREDGSARSSIDFTGLDTPSVGLGLEKTWTDILNSEELTLTLTALQQSGHSQILSSPRLTVINNRPSRIKDGQEQFYYEEYTVKQQILENRSTSELVPSGKPVSITSGVALDVMASIGKDGDILLALNPKVTEDVVFETFATITDRDSAGRVVSNFEIKLPTYRTQDLSTRVIVQSGQTVVMGGVIQRNQSTFVESIPVLGNIPIIGAAFRRRTEIDQPRYLLIFVTATLLSDSGEFIENGTASENEDSQPLPVEVDTSPQPIQVETNGDSTK